MTEPYDKITSKPHKGDVMNRWSKGKPTTFDELFTFYHDYVKALYSTVQADNTLPNETLFELNAALDHISRRWVYQESESEVVSKAFGHLKRSCLDIFKLKVQEARRQYDELREVDTSLIDNGEFDPRFRQLFHEISVESAEARRTEGKPDDNLEVPAFELWENVYMKCEQLRIDFYLHSSADWAKKKTARIAWRELSLAFVLGVLSSIAASWLYQHYSTLLPK